MVFALSFDKKVSMTPEGPLIPPCRNDWNRFVTFPCNSPRVLPKRTISLCFAVIIVLISRCGTEPLVVTAFTFAVVTGGSFCAKIV